MILGVSFILLLKQQESCLKLEKTSPKLGIPQRSDEATETTNVKNDAV